MMLTACGGAGDPQPAFPQESAAQTAVIQYDVDVCSATYTVHRDGTAQRTSQSQGCNTATITTTLPSSVASKLFADLQSAQPLSALPDAGPGVDTFASIGWNGEQSPDIIRANGTTSTIEQSLLNDIYAVVQQFPAQL
jgi:hypothetical protein